MDKHHKIQERVMTARDGKRKKPSGGIPLRKIPYICKVETIWDPLRKKDVALTPEERVRQWFIRYLHENRGVPMHQMMSEVRLECPGGKTYRADIVVYGRGGVPSAIVECKRPEVALTGEVLAQALRYGALLGVGCLILTGGRSTVVCLRGKSSWERSACVPTYAELSAGASDPCPPADARTPQPAANADVDAEDGIGRKAE